MGRIIFSNIDVNVEERGKKKESEQPLTELICECYMQSTLK